VTLNIMALIITTFSINYKTIAELSAVMVSVKFLIVMLNGIMESVTRLNVILLSVATLNIILLNVVAPAALAHLKNVTLA
jgi:hypothetical protein